MDWMTTEGKLILPAERVWLRNAAHTIAQRFGNPTIVNIGVYKCATMYCLRAGAPSARLIGIDLEPPQAKVHPSLKAEFIVGDSRTSHTKVKDPVHILFHDGNHTYDVISVDIKYWIPKVVAGGIVAFHDYNPSRHNRKKRPWVLGVEKAVNERFAQDPEWERLKTPESLGAFLRL